MEKEENHISEKIEIFSSEDERLKFVGQLLTNDASRKLMQILIRKEMSTKQLSDITNLSLSLVIHHVNKMIQSGIVFVSRTSVNSKNQPMKYYSAKHVIMILPEKMIDKANNSKSFFRSLKNIMKFASIGIAGLTTWILTSNIPTNYNDTSSNYMLIAPLVVIILGLITERVLSSKLFLRA